MTTVTAQQLQTLSVYVPPSVARQAFKEPEAQFGGTWRRFHAATLFADISGFTPLTEKLAASGVRGAEELTSVLNQVFEALITTAESYGGRVVKFGGDALSLTWPCPPKDMTTTLWRAIEAAFAMQAAMARFATISTSQGQFALRMKIGISAGELLEVHAGGVFGRWEYVLAGAPMANMSSAENQAHAGEIVIDETAWRLINGQQSSTIEQAVTPHNPADFPLVFGETVAPGFYKITHLRGGLPPEPLIAPDWGQLNTVATGKVMATLRSYIPGAIASLLESGHYDNLAELKPMTVCFIRFDGIDYTNDVDAGPRLSNFMRDAQEIIYYYEGSVNKLAIGDKGSVLLVLFGAPPFFHEDDEVRAIACTLSLCKVATRHNLKAHVGLVAGSVFAGPLGAPQRREYTVIGDTVNLAARLMQKAGDGQVYLDETVYNRAARFFEYNDLGQTQIKGKTESRHIYHALREKEQDHEEAAATSYLLTELTGREKELTIVDQLTDMVWQGHGQILLLNGEAGVGKSRLATEIVRRWLERGGVPHTGDCVSYGWQTPYLPWRGILATAIGLSARLSVEQRSHRIENTLSTLPAPISGSIAAQTATINQEYWLERLPLLADILGLEYEDTNLTRNLSEDLRRDNLFATIKAIAVEEARNRPTLIMLEDTHWSDELSLELAVHLASTIADLPLFLVLVHRPIGSPVPMSYQRLRSMPYSTQLPVNELDLAASLKLVQNKLGVNSLPPALADLIRSKGQGNPFFIEELVNSLVDMDVLKVENDECFIKGDLDTLEMPDTVQKVVLARIDRLPEEEKMTLKVAAAIGRTFQQDLLVSVHPWIHTQNTLEEHLTHLQAEDFTRRETTENKLDFLFKHVITQEVAYETMLYAQRQHLHATIGATIENSYRNHDGEVLDLLAYHYARSNDKPKALRYLERAGQKALNGYANEAAIAYFSEALDVARNIDNVKVQYNLLAYRERAYNRAGNRTAQIEDLSQMKAQAEAQKNPVRQMETGNRQLLLATNLGEYHQAINTAKEMLKLAHQADEPVWEARTLTNLGITYWRQGDYPKARECMFDAYQSDGSFKDNQLKATSLNYLGLIHTQMADYEQARENYRQALEIYRIINDKGGEAGCANNLGLLDSSLGRYPQAVKYYTQALTICHTIGDRLREGISLNTLGQVNIILGNYDQAKNQLENSLTIRQNIGDRRGEAFCLHDLGYLYLNNDQTNQAIDTFQTACNLRRTLGETGNYVTSLSAKGRAYMAHGDVDAAYQCLQEAVQLLEADSGSGEYPTQNIWWIYTQICQQRDQHNEAAQALETAYKLVKAKAKQIRDPNLQRSYLKNVRDNAAILAAVAG